MSFGQKAVAVVLMFALVAGVIYIGNNNNIQVEETQKMSYYQTETIYFWYTDDTFTDMFTNAAVEFHEKHPDIRVIPTLVSSSEYLENINKASLGENENFPDVFVLGNDSLEKAYLSGLASSVSNYQTVLNDNHFGEGALYSVTYKNSFVAYPLYFDTAVLMYNKTYLNEWVEKVNSGVTSMDEGQALDDDGNIITEDVSEVTQQAVSLDDYVPESFDDIISFADSYEAVSGVESILNWDVSSILFNYLFVGNYMIVGGDSGDDTDNINIYNDNTLACASVYQNLNQVFSIDADTSDYATVLNDFLEGKTVYTLVSTDAIAKVNESVAAKEEALKAELEANALDEEDEEEAEEASGDAAESGDTSTEASGDEEASADTAYEPTTVVYEFGYAPVPDVSAELKSRSLSVTNALVINGYSEKKEAANKFAEFLATDYADEIYTRTGKVAASYDAGYTDEAFKTFQEAYAKSIPLPKIVEASNLWMQLEIALKDIWEGEDVDTRIKAFADQIASQLVSE